ncbi:LodA/GoxA family CTQ-dependent oxidase [Aureispira anguillae]|uniref:LodA/GoxA family CTQ-dependent oxidase n=1 Tax=Aureispira anguillae TaxID=2864201 RepID=A0A915YBB9_9BACT|nr:LodA/GoxA family CTQ-dependent oxidase [Aureispira anguillae]BDS09937.1 LodA/GoxA family CTQ-dependent oxidase [Aureispira anguillae]
MTLKTNFRIHPAIGFARVGNSEDYYIEPQTMAGEHTTGALSGGLPIKKGTDATPISSDDIRDAAGKLKKQAARFKIYQYQDPDTLSYPSGGGEEVIIGSTVTINGVQKKVADIVWMVHLANKKANSWVEPEAGIEAYANGNTPEMRNPNFAGTADPSNKTRLQKLMTDAGPRVIQASANETVLFNKTTVPTYWDPIDGEIKTINSYPVSFPASDGDPSAYNDSSELIDYIGELQTEVNGHLLVLGGYGKACGFDMNGDPDPNAVLDHDVNNDNWLDDTGDGPVNAVLIFDDNTHHTIEGSAWVVATDPAYAPQTLNVVSLWDDVYMTWLEELGLEPSIYANGQYNTNYQPYFHDDVYPTLNAAHLQMWNTNLPDKAIKSHQTFSNLTENKPPFDALSFIRNPNIPAQAENGSPLMPLALGDSEKSFLSVSTSQYFFMEQWMNNKCVGATKKNLGPGEYLDKAVLANCLGGRFSPGIDLTFIVRDTNLYNTNWTKPTVGPFRVNKQIMDYSTATTDNPFLGVGYVPLRTAPVEPGDLCKFMSIPWHTDYNSCATHTPAPNPGGDITVSYELNQASIIALNNTYLPKTVIAELETIRGQVFLYPTPTGQMSFDQQLEILILKAEPSTSEDCVEQYIVTITENAVIKSNVYAGNVNTSLFWSWPAQRPVAVYTYEDLVRNNGTLPRQRFSVRGAGTNVEQGLFMGAQSVGRYQVRRHILTNWHKIGTIIQGVAIEGYPQNYDPSYFLEVESQFNKDESNQVLPWPNTVTDKVYPPLDNPDPIRLCPHFRNNEKA